ncbi:MAG TPA: hypothetical protein VGP72_20170 [Planctomycetota bacterium]|jgi:hypothetical protein
MGDELKREPVKQYENPSYPHKDSAEGQKTTVSLGKKLGLAIVAGLLGIALVRGCGSVKKQNGAHPGPPPIRPDFQTEADAKKELEERKKAGTARVEPPKLRPTGEQSDVNKTTEPKAQ